MRRLRTRVQYQAVLDAPVVARSGHFVLHRLRLDPAPAAPFEAGGPWFGVVVPKRWAKRAVTRNAVRRQAASVVGCLPPEPPAVWLLRQRNSFDRLQYRSACSVALKQALRGELIHLFEKARG